MFGPILPIFVNQRYCKVIVKLKVIAFEHKTKNSLRSVQGSTSNQAINGCVVWNVLPYV